ncbi:MAG: phage terminase large subunit family protein [Patescibacteria group bacterium]|nr:phage terminase large subunit family protein [Patescibacteria group bacterium]
MAERIISGLKRTAVKSPSRWAEAYREMPNGRWSFKSHPWLKDMHDSDAEYNVGQKSAQMGFTETLLNVTFHAIDILRKDCLYVLPNKNPDSSDFSSGRFSPALELSPHLKQLFTDTDNIGHKRAGSANLYIRGSQSRSGLKSLPISRLLMDEVAEFCEENIPLAFARTDGQDDKLIWMISTPTIEGHGIGPYWDKTDQRHFNFKCPGCSQYIELKFPESLVITANDIHDPAIKNSYLQCYLCNKKLEHQDKTNFLQTGVWTPTQAGRDWAGFTISQLYSTVPSGHPVELAKFYLASRYDMAMEVEFFNSKLGIPHEAKGARVKEEHLDACIMSGRKNRNNDVPERGLYTMGVDVGPQVLHCEIARWIVDPKKAIGGDISSCAIPIVTKICKVKTFEELDMLMYQYGIVSCVIDSQPERHAAGQFAKRFHGRVKLCLFNDSARGKNIQESKLEVNNDPLIIVNRASWLDQSLGRFINKTISLPIDTDIEYREHIKEPVKTYRKDADGNPVARYITKDGKGDHYAFARTYNEIALVFAAGLGTNKDI